MRAYVSKILVVSTLVCILGGHWAVLQVVAWTGMAIRYCQDSSLKEALIRTFAGEESCQLCKIVQAGRKAEKKQSDVKITTKLDLFLLWGETTHHPPPPTPSPPPTFRSAPFRSETPPTPPPRLA